VKDRRIEWLLQHTNLQPDDPLPGKIGLLRRYLVHDLSKVGRDESVLTRPEFKLDPAVAARLRDFASKMDLHTDIVTRALTTNSGAAYRAECLAAGVPLPVDFGPDSAWIDRGEIPQSMLFIARGLRATVLTLQSTSPPGMCIALPRHNGTTVRLDGIICLGQSGAVCFWDNQDPSLPASNPNSAFPFPLGSAQPISRWVGGTDLRAAVGNVCSDCHAGENPFIIHPNTAAATNPLGSLAGLGLPTFAPDWYEPFVRTGDAVPWPENPGPMNSPPTCTGCHGNYAARGYAGRLPHFSDALPRYCGTILRSAVGALAPPAPPPPGSPVPINPPATMPFGAPGTLACTPGIAAGDPNFRACSMQTTVNCTPAFGVGDPRLGNPTFNVNCTSELANLLSWCGQPPDSNAAGRGDPHITTYNAVDYDFQSGGEFTYLHGFDGLEIQARQTPVPSAGPPPANPHTGLTSCVSVNTAVAARMGKHRVTYQSPMRASANDPPILRIDGERRDIGPRGIKLGTAGRIALHDSGDGLQMIFADGTLLDVTRNWWPDQSLWYMNVDVRNTTAREGVLGAIAPNEWLPNLSDGSSLGLMPASLLQRYYDLNYKFADSWRVRDWTSLFDYDSGQSTKDFTFPDWPPEKPECKVAPGSSSQPSEPIDEKTATQICSKIEDKSIRLQCIFDVSVTGDKGFARAYLASDRPR